MKLFHLVLLMVAGAASQAICAAEVSRGPNIILLVADDLGYGDLGLHGGTEIPTPNIDSIAAHGARFTSGYVTCPVCSPTRAGLITGRYQQRFGHEFNPGPQAAPNFGLPTSETTVAEVLRAAGYKTALVGKWHLGNQPEYVPQRRGFDEFYGFLGGAHAYLPAEAMAPAEAQEPAPARKQPQRPRRRQQQQQVTGRQPILRGAEIAPDPEYLTDAFANEAVDFIRRHRSEPYFLYLAFNAVHNPQHATRKYLDRFPQLTGGRKTYAAMLSALDDAVGEVLGAVRGEAQEQNTLIVFVSDNGGPQGNHSSNRPLSGQKGTVWEGGVRVPYLLQWKGNVPAGKVIDQPVNTLDLFPTVLAAAGVKPPEGKQLDGTDLLPVVRGNSEASAELGRRALFWRFGSQWAVRHGDWKLLSDRNGHVALFNLKDDGGEKNDLSAKEPGRVRELRSAWAEWDTQLAKPLWERQ
jgi:arylsulfatase A-like enzyme